MTMRDRLAADIYALTADSPSKPWTNAERHYCYRLADRLIRRDWVRLDEEALSRALGALDDYGDMPWPTPKDHAAAIIRALREEKP